MVDRHGFENKEFFRFAQVIRRADTRDAVRHVE